MQAPEVSEAVKSIAQKFCDALTTTLSEWCTLKWQVTLADKSSREQPDATTTVSFRCSFGGFCAGDAFLSFPASSLQILSLRDVSVDVPDLQLAQAATLLAGLQDGLAGLAAAIDTSGSTTIGIQAIDSPALTDEHVLELWMQSDPEDQGTRISLHLSLSQKIVEGPRSSSTKPFVFPDALGPEGANLDLVMGVELNVTLRFGQRQLALREVLELTSGSVVELDRQVDEPVELILDGRVVARGEAVIIDGNYGMRITELVPHPLL